MGVKIARMAKVPVGIAHPVIALPRVVAKRPVFTSLQIPTYPVPPPAGAENLGKISWDLPEMVKYTPDAEVSAYVEMINPSDEQRLYCISYYFLSPDGIVASEDILSFMADSQQFQAFYLPAQGVEPAFTTVSFSVSEYDYTFGLRMLLLELVDGTGKVIQETSRVEVMLASEETYREHYGTKFKDFLPMPPNEGPPLPRLLGMYWPWYKKLE